VQKKCICVQWTVKNVFHIVKYNIFMEIYLLNKFLDLKYHLIYLWEVLSSVNFMKTLNLQLSDIVD
jgi:hypothetical protein